MKVVNPSAITDGVIAFEAGFRDALRRKPMNLVKYKNVILVKSYRRGYERGKKGQ